MRRNPESTATRRAEIVGMLRSMPTKWRRAYNTARRTLADNGGPVLPDVPTPEQAMLILGNTAGRNRDTDQPTGDQPVPQGVRDEAMHGLRLSYKHDYPGWEFFGIARAIQLVLAPGVPMRTRERMKRYLEAHQKDKLAPHYGDEERPSNGYMAMLNWGGDAGLAWNEDVKRATYSSRTRGEGPAGGRRKNPLFYRERDMPSRSWRPIREKALRELSESLGEEAFNNKYKYEGDNEPFWTWDRMEDFRARNPDIRNASYRTPEEAASAVLLALNDMVIRKNIPDLAFTRGEMRVLPLADAVPLIRDLGVFTTRASATDRQTIYPYRVGLLGTPHDKRRHDRGRVIQAPSYGPDFGPEEVNPYIAEHMTRPTSRKVVAGEVVYLIPPGTAQGDTSKYEPYRVLRVSLAPPETTGLDYRPSDLLTIRPADTAMSVLHRVDYSHGHADLVVNEWAVLKEDEMPPDTDYPRAVTPKPPSAVEALTAAATRPSKGAPKVVAVLSEPSNTYYEYVVLFDPAVLVKGELSEADVLGFTTAEHSSYRNEATISVAAAEPGYAFLMYATLAKHIASQHPGAALRGSTSQTEYAKRFWSKQPNGAIVDMPPALFKRTFRASYASITSAGEELVRRLANALGTNERSARNRLRALGSTYFDDYYRVSSTASSRLGPAKLPRPASPRQTVEEVKKLTARKLSSNSLALVTVNRSRYGHPVTLSYLLSVPKGKSTLTPANLLAEFDPVRPTLPGERVGDFAEVFGPLAARSLSPEAAKVRQVLREYNTTAETARARREVAKWSARGETLKAALAAAGMTDLDGFFAYLMRGASGYGERAQRIAQEGSQRLNPRRKKFEVTVVMPS